MTTASQPPPAVKRSSTGVRIVLLLWLSVLGIAAIGAFALGRIYAGDVILAGVSALGVELVGASPEEASQRLQSQWNSHRVILDGGGRSWSVTPDQLGLNLDADATTREALALGRPDLAPENFLAVARRLVATTGLAPLDADPIAAKPSWRFDRAQASATLRSIAAQLEIPVRDAGIAVSNGQIETTPAVPGRYLDIAAVVSALESQPWASLLAQGAPIGAATFMLPLVSKPPAVTDVSGLVAELSPMLAQSVEASLWDPIRDERFTWSAPPAETGRWLSFAPGELPGTLTWDVDGAKVADYVIQESKRFGDERYVDAEEAVPVLAAAFKSRSPGVTLRVRHGERTHLVQPGETLSSIGESYGLPYPWLQAANPEIGDNLLAGATIKVPSADALVPLPIVADKRIKVSIPHQKMWAFEDGKLKWEWTISTGLPDSPTSPGVFQIQSHEDVAYAANWDLYMPSFMGIYRPAPGQEFMNGFHGFPSRDRKQILWERSLGRPVTYGCILLDTENAKKLYDWGANGVIVEIAKE